MRYRLRKEHGASRQGKMGVACVFSREAVLQPAPPKAQDAQGSLEMEILQVQGDEVVQSDGSLNCHGYGSVVSVTSTFGVCATGWALSKIAG
jgi:tRNA A37 threonylcarbamoyladenosine dehydratase